MISITGTNSGFQKKGFKKASSFFGDAQKGGLFLRFLLCHSLLTELPPAFGIKQYTNFYSKSLFCSSVTKYLILIIDAFMILAWFNVPGWIILYICIVILILNTLFCFTVTVCLILILDLYIIFNDNQ